MLLLGSHVGMSGKEMLLGSAREAFSYGANTFMIYTGAPQNTRRKDISLLNIDAGWDFMSHNNIHSLVVHAPYIINLANSISRDTFALATDFLALELERSKALKSTTLILHPGAHVGAGEEKGIKQIISGLNEVLTADTSCHIALETMAGKGSEIGYRFEHLARIMDGVHYNDKLRVCFDTCHVHDSGYDIVRDFDNVLHEFDTVIGKENIAVFHINDSKNPCGSRKDRHENIGKGHIGFAPLFYLVHHPDFENVPKILETPYIPDPDSPKHKSAPYKEEISALRQNCSTVC